MRMCLLSFSTANESFPTLKQYSYDSPSIASTYKMWQRTTAASRRKKEIEREKKRNERYEKQENRIETMLNTTTSTYGTHKRTHTHKCTETLRITVIH